MQPVLHCRAISRFGVLCGEHHRQLLWVPEENDLAGTSRDRHQVNERELSGLVNNQRVEFTRHLIR